MVIYSQKIINKKNPEPSCGTHVRRRIEEWFYGACDKQKTRKVRYGLKIRLGAFSLMASLHLPGMPQPWLHSDCM